MGEITIIDRPADGLVTRSWDGQTTHFVTFGGRTRTLAQWARELAIHPRTLYDRLVVKKLTPQEAFKKKVQHKHGMTGSPEWRVWVGMRARCNDKSARGYDDYGGRGIKVCPEWEEDFLAFYEHVGPRPSDDHTIERMDSTRGYEPGNVRWATRPEQARNTRANVVLEFRGEKKVLLDWAREFGLPVSTLWNRLFELCWPLEKALTTPKKKRRSKSGEHHS